MPRIIFLAGLVLVLGMTGCVKSLHQLYTKDNLTFDSGLIGTWIDEDGENIWIFERAYENTYKLKQLEGGEETKSGAFEAHLVKVGGHLYLDLYPDKPETKSDLYKFHLLPVHSFLRLSLEGDSLRMTMLDLDWLRRKIKESELNPSHVVVDNEIVLTGSSEELQEFLVKIADEEKAFCDWTELKRRN